MECRCAGGLGTGDSRRRECARWTGNPRAGSARRFTSLWIGTTARVRLTVVSLILWSLRAAVSLSAVNIREAPENGKPAASIQRRNETLESPIRAGFEMVEMNATVKRAGIDSKSSRDEPSHRPARDGAGERPPQRQEVGAPGRGRGQVLSHAENARSLQLYGVIWDISTEGADARIAPA